MSNNGGVLKSCLNGISPFPQPKRYLIFERVPNRTGIATESGEVAATAQGEEVGVSDGTQTLIRFGEPPLPPTPIPSVPVFYYRLNSVVRDGLRYWVLVGRIDPINQVYVNDELQTVDRLGLFNYEILAHRGANLQVRVVTPLGNETAYVVPIL